MGAKATSSGRASFLLFCPATCVSARQLPLLVRAFRPMEMKVASTRAPCPLARATLPSKGLLALNASTSHSVFVDVHGFGHLRAWQLRVRLEWCSARTLFVAASSTLNSDEHGLGLLRLSGKRQRRSRLLYHLQSKPGAEGCNCLSFPFSCPSRFFSAAHRCKKRHGGQSESRYTGLASHRLARPPFVSPSRACLILFVVEVHQTNSRQLVFSYGEDLESRLGAKAR